MFNIHRLKSGHRISIRWSFPIRSPGTPPLRWEAAGWPERTKVGKFEAIWIFQPCRWCSWLLVACCWCSWLLVAGCLLLLLLLLLLMLLLLLLLLLWLWLLLLLLFPPTPRSRAFFQTYSPMEIGCLCAFRTLGVRFRVSGGGGCFCSRFVHWMIHCMIYTDHTCPTLRYILYTCPNLM